MLLLYDSNVYRVGSKKTDSCAIYDNGEALKLNELLWLKALENIYYSRNTKCSSILTQSSKSASISRTIRFDTVSEPLLDDSRRDAGFLIQLSKHDLNIRLHPSFVKIRKAARRVPGSYRKPQVRSENMNKASNAFNEEVKKGNYHKIDFFKYLQHLSKKIT
jgi:hypothetical protein